jgi:hypothetical protein
MNVKNIARLQLLVNSTIFAALLHHLHFNGYDRLQNLNEILQLQPFWMHLVVAISFVIINFFHFLSFLFAATAILIASDISSKAKLSIILLTLWEFCRSGIYLVWLELVWFPYLLVDFTSCITHTIIVVSTLIAVIIIAKVLTVSDLRKTRFLDSPPMRLLDIGQFCLCLLCEFFISSILCLILILISLASLVSGLWAIFLLLILMKFLFSIRFDRLVMVSQSLVFWSSMGIPLNSKIILFSLTNIFLTI